MKQCVEQVPTELKQYIPIDVDQKDFDGALQSEWFMPDEYKELCIKFVKARNLLSNNETVFEKNYKHLQNVV